MTTPNGTVGNEVEGLVEARNERGIRVAGEWRNMSKFHPLDLPDRGVRVRCELDGKRFLRSVQVLDSAPSLSSPTRDRTITRLAVLKAASNFLGLWGQNREDVRSRNSPGCRPTSRTRRTPVGRKALRFVQTRPHSNP
jgi:hypothetical protein